MRRGIEITVIIEVTEKNGLIVKYEIKSNTTKVDPFYLVEKKIYNLDTVQQEIMYDLERVKKNIEKYYTEREKALSLVDKLSGTYKVTSQEVVKVDM